MFFFKRLQTTLQHILLRFGEYWNQQRLQECYKIGTIEKVQTIKNNQQDIVNLKHQISVSLAYFSEVPAEEKNIFKLKKVKISC